MGGGQEFRTPHEAGGNHPSASTATQRSGSNKNPLQHPEFIKKVKDGLKEWRVPGLSVAVVDGEDTWAEGFGWAKVPDSWLDERSQQAGHSKGDRKQCQNHGIDEDEEGGVKATSQTLWYAGSTTKAFTAAVFGMMIHADDESASRSEHSKDDKSDTGSSLAGTTPSTTTATSIRREEKKGLKTPESYRAPFASKGWRTPMSSLIRDDFVLSDEWATQHITVEDALSHRTGLARHDKTMALTFQNSPDSPWHGGNDEGRTHRAGIRDWTRALRYLPLVMEARVSFRYCNLMFIAAAHAIESTTGMWLGDIMKQWIWGPLGMGGTFLSLRDAQERGGGHLAEGYDWYSERRNKDQEEGKIEGEEEDEGVIVLGGGEVQRFHHIPNMHLRGGSGAGGIISSVHDYAKWVRCLLKESSPLSKEVHRSIKEPRMVAERSNIDWKTGKKRNGFDGPQMYSLGWFCGTYRGHRVFTHSGGMEAYSSQVYFFPDLGFGVVTMGNTAVTAALLGETLAWGLVDDRLGVKEEERFDWAKQRKEALKKAMQKPETALDDLFPHRAKPGLPKALPLEEYTGTYYHPAYQDMVIELNAKGRTTTGSAGDLKQTRELYAAQLDHVWKQEYEFAHVSGEHWLIYIDFYNVTNGTMGQFARAEFKIGSAGKVEAIQVEYMDDGNEGTILYEKVK